MNDTGRAVSDGEAVLVMRRVVEYHAKRLSRHDRSLTDDLTQVGLMGAMEAARAFDPARGVAFKSYAVSRVWGAMKDYLRDHEDHLTRVQRERVAGGGEPFKVVSLNRRSGDRLEGADRNGWVRIDPPHHDPEPSDGPEAEFVAWVRGRFPGRATPDQLRLLAAYYVGDKRQREIGEEMGICESRVSQVMTAALSALNGGARPAAGKCGKKPNRAGYSKRHRPKAVPA